MRAVACVALVGCGSAQHGAGSSDANGPPVVVPAHLENERFYIVSQTADGRPFRLFTDTGGGLLMYDDAVARLGIQPRACDVDGHRMTVAPLPPTAPNASIPQLDALGGALPVVPSAARHDPQDAMDGLLGQAWFGERVWTFDYACGRILLWPEGASPRTQRAHTVRLGFQTSPGGIRVANYPRIEADVDGERIEFLFDTGATVRLRPEALGAIHDGRPALRAANFIIATRFDAWHTHHPDWTVVENADAIVQNEPMIRVPSVRIAGFDVGPVWFTRRADANFHSYMSQFTDRPIDGALGGETLHFFRITVDYPAARASFERAASCPASG